MVTVLFADLVGFTARAERLDPEDAKAILHAYYARLRSEIESFGGTVEKFIGDAVMAVFGAPVAHGDDPERAVRTALAIRDAVTAMNREDPELDLQVRIAVNTGEAVVSLGTRVAEGEGMVTGDVVNTASRLQTAAPVNSILVGEETFHCTRSVIEYDRVEPLVVKGKREPVTAWLALRAATLPGERAVRGAPLVGRQHELAVLQRVWQGVVAERQPHLVTILGDAGIGKTRLAAELCAEMERAGGRTLRGRALPYGASTPYGPFSAFVKQSAGIFASDTVPAAVDKLRRAVAVLVAADVDTVSAHVAMLVGLASEGDVADRRSLFLSARRYVEGLAAAQPTALVFEDLQWADTSMLDLLEMLAARAREAPLMLLALARPELAAARPGWGGGLPAATTLQLRPLSAADSRELAAWILSELGDPVAGDDALRAAQTAEGNPLFIEELASALMEKRTKPAGELPTNVRGIIAARLDALPEPERALLLDASVVGRVFWRNALVRMGNDRARVADILDALEARDLVVHEPSSWIENDQQYSFKHVLIREVAYATVPRTRRRERHAAVAAFLESATAGAGATATALAQHWREAGDPTRAADYLLIAADQAGRGWAKDEAVALYRQALELIPATDAERRRDVGRRHAVALQALYHVEDARLLARRPAVEAADGAP